MLAPGTPSIGHLHVLVQSRSITASKCISNPPRSQPPNSHNHGLQVYMSKLARSWPPSASPNSLYHRLQVYIQTRSITAFKCITKFTPSLPPSVSPDPLDHRLQVPIQTCSITALECISEFTLWSFSGAPEIALKHCLQPGQIYGVLMGSDLDQR